MLYNKKSLITDEPYITRIEHPSGASGLYWVRFAAGSGEQQFFVAHCTFTDNEYGSPGKALKAAKIWRDATRIKLGKGAARKHNLRKRAKISTSNTGFVGVCRRDFIRSNGRRETFFAVSWQRTTEEGKRKQQQKNFYFNRDDSGAERRALENAKRHREKMGKQHYTS